MDRPNPTPTTPWDPRTQSPDPIRSLPWYKDAVTAMKGRKL